MSLAEAASGGFRREGPAAADLLAAALAGVLPQGVAVASRDPRRPGPPPTPAEAVAVEGAVTARRQEFAAGRAAARAALAASGLPGAEVPMAANRAPLWPSGFSGSISHSDRACVALAAPQGAFRALGLDVERDMPLAPADAAAICTPSEQAWLASRDDGARLATLIFSAKECAYKAQHALTGRLLDFRDVEVSLDAASLGPDVAGGAFVASFAPAAGLAEADRRMEGRWLREAGHVATVICLAARPAPAAAPAVALPYLIVSPIEYVEDAEGAVWIDRLWHHDLMTHLDHIADLRVIAPRLGPRGGDPGLDPPSGFVRVEPPAETRLHFLPLPDPRSTAAALLRLPATARALVRAIRDAAIVHSGAAGWPLPLGGIANPIAVLLGKPLVVVIESAFWRVPPGTPVGPARWLRHHLTEALARWSVRHAALAVVTSEGYRASLAAGARGRVLVSPATWIGDADILDDDAAAAAWAAKPERASFVFAGRMNLEKGVGVLLAALEILESEGVALDVDVIGSGALVRDCRAVAARLATVRLGVHEPLDYGSDFFRFLGRHHALLVPTLTDEQPRILFDAFAQGVPVIASRTPGHSDIVREGGNGRLVPAGDPAALAAAMRAAAADTDGLRRMGAAALLSARERTHEAMHRLRAEALADLAASLPAR